MAGFRSLARQVRDPRLLPAQQRSSLRRCLEHFAPYGHRATWHHLCTAAGFDPGDRHPPHRSLVAALAELEEARAVWLAYEAEFAARRRREKYHGIRRPSGGEEWSGRACGGGCVAWCPDPAVHPADRLAVVVRRLITALESAPGRACPVCGSPDLAWGLPLGRRPWSGPVCGGCGIAVPRPVLAPEALPTATMLSKRLESAMGGSDGRTQEAGDVGSQGLLVGGRAAVGGRRAGRADRVA